MSIDENEGKNEINFTWRRSALLSTNTNSLKDLIWVNLFEISSASVCLDADQSGIQLNETSLVLRVFTPEHDEKTE